jgi:eukaryotic-like serine/threonine-protein kinase
MRYHARASVMSLPPGTRLGVFEILSPLGAGGMGEVYRAHDTRLNRDVAIKVLPDLFASDPDRLARFTREAQTLASLNHPNIASVHGLEETGSVRAIVMELVAGDDLAAIMRRGPVSLAEAVAIARQIADALEVAHELGIIHRDLKPANVKVRPDGTVKVLDFGLAKVLTPENPHEDLAGSAIANSPTLTARATRLGLILGTAAYMRFARGLPMDRAGAWYSCRRPQKSRSLARQQVPRLRAHPAKNKFRPVHRAAGSVRTHAAAG